MRLIQNCMCIQENDSPASPKGGLNSIQNDIIDNEEEN